MSRDMSDEIEIMSESESGTVSQTGTVASVPSASRTTGLFVPSKSKSDIWKVFKLKKDEDNKVWAVCLKCPKSLAYCGATTTLWNHAEQVHFIPKPKKTKHLPLQQPQEQVTVNDFVPPPTASTSAHSSSRQADIRLGTKSSTRCWGTSVKDLLPLEQ